MISGSQFSLETGHWTLDMTHSFYREERRKKVEISQVTRRKQKNLFAMEYVQIFGNISKLKTGAFFVIC